jgi:amidase
LFRALIAFNVVHAKEELEFFGQDVFEAAAAKSTTVTAVQHQAIAAAAEQRAIATLHGTMDEHDVAVLLTPTGGPAWPIEPRDDFSGGLCSALAAVAGSPLITVPTGTTWRGSLPLGATLVGRRFSDGLLLGLANEIERLLPAAPTPQLLGTVGYGVEGSAD